VNGFFWIFRDTQLPDHRAHDLWLPNETQSTYLESTPQLPSLGPTSSWQLPGSAFYAPPRRRILSTLSRASPSDQPQLWIISR
ncbi:hypothetical protein GOODEAATRI_023455, partial [Goodea atripinnis]